MTDPDPPPDSVFWLSAFLDVPADDHARDAAFWRAVTGYGLSPNRGEHGELVTLVPPDGDAHLRLQRLGEGPSRVHLDVHVDSLDEATARAQSLGAVVVDRPGHVVMRSPGGFTCCFVTHPGSVRAAPARWTVGEEGAPGGALLETHRSLVDQVCLDIPAPSYDAECTFWARLLDRPVGRSSVRAEFRHLVRAQGQPLRLLLQRLDDGEGPVRAHLDLATDDRDAEVARHLSLGAVPVRRTAWWTTLQDPAGLDYCVTDRDPETGMTP